MRPPQQSDAQLVGEAVAGQSEALARLIRRHQDRAYGTAVGMLSDFDLARDVVQEAFLRACRDIHKLRDPARFAGWLHGIVRNTAREAMRELRRVRAMAEELKHTVEPFAPTPPADVGVEESERRRLVREALERLGQKNREVVSLHYVDGLSYADIAEYLDVTKATVQGRLQRGRRELRKELLTMVEETFKDERLPEDFAEQVRRLLDAADAAGKQRQQAVRRLADMGAPAVDPLCEALGDPRVAVRRAAARALCIIGDPRALRPILKVLYSGDYFLDSALLRSGQVLRIPGVRDELLGLLDTGTDQERYWAIAALTHATGDDEVIERLGRIYRDTEVPWGPRGQALAALC
ncbi:hypothetical protein LCGC14_2351550, partial [marine sediment metagenome]